MFKHILIPIDGSALSTEAVRGRGAVGGLILGSETGRVLAHSRIPVLVAR